MQRTITLVGGRGGQGTTTVATALALMAASDQRTTLITTDPMATAAVIGMPLSSDTVWVDVPGLVLTRCLKSYAAAVVVIDAGTALTAPPVELDGNVSASTSERYGVLRGPCYLALSSLLTAPGPPLDGVILVSEDGRSLNARDVADVLDIPVVATVKASPAVARTIDAGLFPSRLHRLRELDALRHLAAAPPASTRLRQPPTAPLRTGTDLPLSRGDNSVEGRAPVKRCPDRRSDLHVGKPWSCGRRSTSRAEHRSPLARRRRLLPR